MSTSTTHAPKRLDPSASLHAPGGAIILMSSMASQRAKPQPGL
jgi:hypothetical protein